MRRRELLEYEVRCPQAVVEAVELREEGLAGDGRLVEHLEEHAQRVVVARRRPFSLPLRRALCHGQRPGSIDELGFLMEAF